MPGEAQRGPTRGRTRGELTRAVEDRRARVWTLSLVRKLTIREIGEVVGVSKRTVDRDLATVRKRVHEKLKQSGKLESAVLDAAAEIIEETNAVARQAWAEMMEAPKGSPARGRFLRIILTTLEDRVKLLQSLGVVKRVPEEVLIGGLEIERRLAQLTDEQANAALDFLDELLQPAERRDQGDP